MMKRLVDYTEEELLKLSDKEIVDLMDLECMCEGVPVAVVEPKYLVVPDLPAKDVTLYQVEEMLFSDKEDALRVKNALEATTSRVTEDYHYSVGYDHKYVQPISDPVAFKQRACYSKSTYDSIASILKSRKSVIDKNDAMRAAYNEQLSARNEIAAQIREAIATAEDHAYQLARHREVYQRYLELSNGDALVAQNFFKSNYPSLEEDKLAQIFNVLKEEE